MADLGATLLAASLLTLAYTQPTCEADPLQQAGSPVHKPCRQPWMERWAERERLTLRACRRLELDQDGRWEEVVQACSEDGHRAVYLVQDNAARWVIDHSGWGHFPVCQPAAYSEGGVGISLLDTGAGEHEERRVALRDGRPVVVMREFATAREPPGARQEVWDFDSGRIHRIARQEQGCAGPASLDAEGSLLVLGAPEISARWVRSGLLSQRGDADGRLRVRATPTLAGDVRLNIAVDDDALVALPASGFGTAIADTVVLRWAEANAASDDPLGCDGTEITELRITAARDGPPQISGKGSTSARVEGTFSRLTVDLDLRDLGIGPVLPWYLPFTLEFVDVDAEGTTVLATSRFVAGQPGTLGAIVRHQEDRRHPRIGTAVQ